MLHHPLLFHNLLFHCKSINIFIGTLIAMMVFVLVADERAHSIIVIASTNPSRLMWSRSRRGLLGCFCLYEVLDCFRQSGSECCGPAAKVLHYKNRLPLRD